MLARRGSRGAAIGADLRGQVVKALLCRASANIDTQSLQDFVKARSVRTLIRVVEVVDSLPKTPAGSQSTAARTGTRAISICVKRAMAVSDSRFPALPMKDLTRKRRLDVKLNASQSLVL